MPMNVSVLVTGATGFLGRDLIQRLLADGFSVIALTRKPFPSTDRLRVVVCARGMSAVLPEMLRSEEIQTVIHAAGRLNGSQEQIARDNEELTRELVQEIAAFNKDIRFLYISSVSAIPQLGDYGRSKRQSERILEESALSTWQIFRPSLLYGKGDDKNVAKLISWVQRFPLVPVLGGKKVKLQPLFVGDLYTVLHKALRGAGTVKGTYTLAGPRQEPLWDMIGDIADRLGKRVWRVPIPLGPVRVAMPVAQAMLPFLRLPVQQVRYLHDHPAWDSSAAVKDFGFQPRIFREGLLEVL